MNPGGVRVRRLATADLTRADVAAVRTLMEAAFGDDPDERFTEDDWQHAVGGTHVLLDVDGELVSHASVVARRIEVAGRPLRAGYVEAVATAPGRQGLGHGTVVMEEVGRLIRERFELGVLGTGSHHFYERLGWTTWTGPSFVRSADGLLPTPADDGYLMVLRTPSSPVIDTASPISCEWRPGDVW